MDQSVFPHLHNELDNHWQILNATRIKTRKQVLPQTPSASMEVFKMEELNQYKAQEHNDSSFETA